VRRPGSGPSSYTDSMSIVRNIAGAKGMSITFREMLNPTEVENYPDGPGPNRGAHSRTVSRSACLQGMRMALRNVSPVSCARQPAQPTAFILRQPRTPRSAESRALNAMPRSITSTTTGASLRLCVEACPTDAITHGHGFELASPECHDPHSSQGKICWSRPSGCQIASVPKRRGKK